MSSSPRPCGAGLQTPPSRPGVETQNEFEGRSTSGDGVHFPLWGQYIPWGNGAPRIAPRGRYTHVQPQPCLCRPVPLPGAFWLRSGTYGRERGSLPPRGSRSRFVGLGEGCRAPKGRGRMRSQRLATLRAVAAAIGLLTVDLRLAIPVLSLKAQ